MKVVNRSSGPVQNLDVELEVRTIKLINLPYLMKTLLILIRTPIPHHQANQVNQRFQSTQVVLTVLNHQYLSPINPTENQAR